MSWEQKGLCRLPSKQGWGTPVYNQADHTASAYGKQIIQRFPFLEVDDRPAAPIYESGILACGFRYISQSLWPAMLAILACEVPAALAVPDDLDV